jgi:hypothetical protein
MKCTFHDTLRGAFSQLYVGTPDCTGDSIVNMTGDFIVGKCNPENGTVDLFGFPVPFLFSLNVLSVSGSLMNSINSYTVLAGIVLTMMAVIR